MCPICGGECGYREIEPYYREVRELWPFRSGMVPVSRFQCRGTAGRFPTFSMLPYQLVPYHRYTIGAMVQALLVWREYWKGGSGSSYLLAAELDTEAGGESGMTSSLLRLWGLMFQRWLRRAQSELALSYDFCSVSFHGDFPSILDELFGYFESLSRGPPSRGEAVVACVHEHGRETGRFLFGVPSQGR